MMMMMMFTLKFDRKLNEDVESAIIPGGNRIHNLLEISFKVNFCHPVK